MDMATCPIFAWSIIDESQIRYTGVPQINDSITGGDKVDVFDVWNLRERERLCSG